MQKMRCIVLGSGSKGNATLIEAGATRVLIDNGFSAKELLARLRLSGIAPESLSALLLTHEHNDHVAGVGVLSRRLGLPVYANVPTFRAAETKLGTLPVRHECEVGERFTVGGVEIHAFSVSHDTADPVGYTVSDGRHCVGYCTDTGQVTQMLRHSLAACHALVLEANHDVAMLKAGPYPLALQQRVLSKQGHLSNVQSLDLVTDLLGAGCLRSLVLAHRSEINNSPEKIRAEIAERAEDLAGLTVRLANQHEPTDWLEVAA